MRHLATLIAITILTTISATAQSTTNGALRQSSTVVTNEQDLVGIEFARTNLVMKIHNQANVNEWIDGAGNKYVVSNLWSMTFSADFGENVFMPTARTNYVFSSVSQVYIEGTPVRWWINVSYIYHFPGGFYNREWLPTTNALVLDPVLATGATGHAYIRPYSTTNIATLATTAQVAIKWQNPTSATNWMWASNGSEITLTNYNIVSGGASVVIPDMLDGLPVTTLDRTFSFYDEGQDESFGQNITSVRGGSNIRTISDSCFKNCFELQEVTLNAVTNIGIAAFFSCKNLNNVNIESVVHIRESAFDNCTNLTQITLPSSLRTIEPWAFSVRQVPSQSLNVFFSGDRPAVSDEPSIFDSRPSVTNYVTSPTATGWGATFGGMPVVRLPMYGTPADGLTAATVTNIVRATSLSSQTWTAAGTNATYQLTWDITNKTFKVLEILP
jgi:hypothetical protein